jgi:hypothetical protein
MQCIEEVRNKKGQNKNRTQTIKFPQLIAERGRE